MALFGVNWNNLNRFSYICYMGKLIDKMVSSKNDKSDKAKTSVKKAIFHIRTKKEVESSRCSAYEYLV